MRLQNELGLGKRIYAVRQVSFHKQGRIFVYLLLAAFLISLGSRDSLAQERKLTARDKNDIRAVLANKKDGKMRPLDLSNPVHNRFLRKQYERAGITPKVYPQLFKSLQQASRSPRASLAAQAVPSVPSGPQPQNIITDIKTSDQQNFVANALSSVPNNTAITILTLGLYDKDLNPIGPVGEEIQFNGGTNVMVSVQGSFMNQAPAEGQLVQVLGSYYYEKSGLPFSGALEASSNFYPASIVSTAPNVVKDPNKIHICINRQGSTAGCDYACNQGLNCTLTPNSGLNLIFPVIGQIIYNGNIDPIQFNENNQPTNALSRITVTWNATGGGCNQQQEQTNFFKDPKTIVNGNTLSWNLNPAQFGIACYQETKDVTYSFMVRVNVNNQPVMAFINNTTTTDSKSTLRIKPTEIVIGCLAEGSVILMEDRSERPIEFFDAQERVLGNGDGKILTVTGTLVGNEEKPMVRIITDKNQSLLLTRNHPVITPAGVRLAKKLKVGEEVVTIKGNAKIISSQEELFLGRVWNLIVGAPQDNINISNDNTTFFANGILVGDGQMQDYWTMMDQQSKSSVLEELPKKWHQDYLNHLKAHKLQPQK